jgi:hypothetical protein
MPTSDEHWDKIRHHVTADRPPFAGGIPEDDPEPDPPVPAEAPRPSAPPLPEPFPGEPGDVPDGIPGPRPPEREPIAALDASALCELRDMAEHNIRTNACATMLLTGCATLLAGVTRALAYLQPGDLDAVTKSILSRELQATQRMLEAQQPPAA